MIGDKSKPQVGNSAFKFNIDGFNLDNYIGTVVVLSFYPKDDTPGCTSQAKDFSENQSFFDELDVKILGVSKDSRQTHEKFKEKYNITFDLISDTENLCELYGIWVLKSMFGKSYMGVQRATFLIDKLGKIAF